MTREQNLTSRLRQLRDDFSVDINRPYIKVLNYRTIDEITITVLWINFAALLLLALLNSWGRIGDRYPSPFAWHSITSQQAIWVFVLSLIPTAYITMMRGKIRNHYVWRLGVAALLCLYSFLFIFTSAGSIEMHFHFFLVVTYLSVYADWRLAWFVLLLNLAHQGVSEKIDPDSVFAYGANNLALVAHALPALAAALCSSLICTYHRRSVTTLTEAQEAITEEFSERQRLEQQMYELAFYDQLTQLPNTTLFGDRFEHLLASAREQHSKMAIYLLDIDRFKAINDLVGHSGGNHLLREVSNRLRRAVGDNLLLSRQGEDEFILVQSNIEGRVSAEVLAQKMLGVFSEVFVINGKELPVHASMGVCFFPDDAEQGESLIACANAAMYNAKRQSGNSYQFYKPHTNKSTADLLELESDLRKAIEKGELEAYYQPQYDFVNKKIGGTEALLRWHHPSFGMVSPSTFIAAAEESGIIVEIGAWILNQACEQTKKWHDAGYPNLVVSVNVSPHQLQPILLQTVQRALARSNLPAHCLELELTESSLLPDDTQTLKLLEDLRGLGVELCVDDFGTGYSSLSRISSLPVDVLKIDRSFIMRITEETRTFSVVRAIISIAHSLQLKVVAEGVETSEQAEFLNSLRCDSIQGYLISQPVPPDQIPVLIQRNANKSL